MVFSIISNNKNNFYRFKENFKNNELSLFANCVFVTYLGYILGIKGYWLPFSLDVAMLSIIFYYFGYILKNKNILIKILNDYKILFVILLLWIIGIKYNWIELAIRKYTNGAFSIITAICGSIIVIKISQLISIYLKPIGNILSWYGKNSMYILMIHYIELGLVNYNVIIKNPTNSTIMKFSISILKLIFVTLATLFINGVRMCVHNIKMLKNKKIKEEKNEI